MRPRLPILWQIALGLGLSLAAALGQHELREAGFASLYLLPYPAVLFAATFGGLVAGLVAIAATTIGLTYFAVEPLGSFVIAMERDAIDLVTYCVLSLVLVVLIERRRGAFEVAAKAQLRAEEASSAKEAMMTVIAHDLRSPLQTVILTAELLSHRSDIGERSLKLVERMRRAAERAALLVDAALEQAHQGRAMFELRALPWRLEELVDETVALFQPMAAARSLTLLSPEKSALDATVYCDRERVLQVLSNILGNAIKFTPPGGTIRIGARCDDEGAHFEVADTGPGMTDDELAHCFERLWHGTKPGHGSGLGLWIAKTLVDAHGGRIEASSKPGAGTTLRFHLPPGPAPESLTSRGLVEAPV